MKYIQLCEKLAPYIDVSPESLRESDNLMDHGMNSMQVLEFVESCNQEGIEADFAVLAQDPTVGAWWNHIQEVMLMHQKVRA